MLFARSSAAFGSGRYDASGRVRSITPSAASCITIDAKTGLLSDAASKTVSPVTLSSVPARRIPKPSTATAAPRTVAIAIPGTLASASSVGMSGAWTGALLDDIALSVRRAHAAASRVLLAASHSRRCIVRVLVGRDVE
jgi:hypothetical protein